MPAKKTPTKKKASKTKPEKVSAVQIRHKMVMKKMVENGGNLGKALRDTNYSEAVANHPSRVTGTQSFKKLLDKYLPEDMLLEIHQQQVHSWKLQQMNFDKKVEDKDIYELLATVQCVVQKIIPMPSSKLVFYICPDNQSRNKALELGLKLRKKLTDKIEVEDKSPYAALSDAELAARMAKARKFFLKK